MTTKPNDKPEPMTIDEAEAQRVKAERAQERARSKPMTALDLARVLAILSM